MTDPRSSEPGARPASIRRILAFLFVGLLAFSGYGLFAPADLRCGLPGAVGCPGGVLGAPVPAANATSEMFFNVSMFDYGFWIVNTVDGTNATRAWNVYEGWKIHVNATSLPADPSVGGTAYHGIGVELNATGQQLLSLSAPVGRWVASSFTAPTRVYTHQHVWCTIECGDGHSGMYVNILNVVSPGSQPSATASADRTSGPAPLLVNFTGTATGGRSPYTAAWNFGDGTTGATTLNTSHIYQLSGVYSATLTVTDSNGVRAVASVSVTVSSSGPLTAGIAVSRPSGVAPFSVYLNGSATGGAAPYGFAWSFGDGSTGTGTDVLHLYTAPGVYAIQLNLTDSLGSHASAVASVTVQAASGSLNVAATATPSSGTAPVAIAFGATVAGGTAPYQATWVFGDGALGQGLAASHTYAALGNYVATVFVTDSAGHAGSNGTSVTVAGATGSPLRAVLTESPSGGSPPLAVQASVSSVGGSGSYAAPTWAFGDGTTATGPTASHVYPLPGAYVLSVTVRDGSGATATAFTVVEVHGLVVAISLNRTVGDAPLALSAAASIAGGTGTYQPVAWTWGDGSTASGTTANHTYAANATGTLTVRTSVTDSAGATANATATVKILPPPSVVVIASPPVAHTVPADVNFTINVTGGSGNYSTAPLWNFGDGSTTRGIAGVNHTYLKLGHFHITVQTNDSYGGVALGEAWVNISAASAGSTGNAPASGWGFNGVGNPDQAALALIGLMALGGLGLLYRSRRKKAAKAASGAGVAAVPPTARSPPTPATVGPGPRVAATRPPNAPPAMRPLLRPPPRR